MSFRIEDILKKDTKSESYCDKKSECFSPTAADSILQKTLLNRPNFQYYRSVSEPFAGSSVWCQNERMCHSQECEIYRPKALSYPSIYTRSPIWPNYTFPVAFFPPVCHFSKRKGGQVRFTANQTDALEQRFVSHKYLSPEDRKLLADSLKLTDRQVKTWFQNRRAKWRRCNSVCSTGISTSKFEENKMNNVCKQTNEILLKSHD